MGHHYRRRRQCRALRGDQAAEAGRRVLVLEAAPKPYRGGNSATPATSAACTKGPLSVLTDSYGEDEYFDDLMLVTRGKTDEPSGAAGDPHRPKPACPGWRRMACGSSPRCRAPCRSVADQRLLPRRRQGAGERLLQHRRGPGRHGRSMTPRYAMYIIEGDRFTHLDVADRRSAHCGSRRARWCWPRAGFRPTSTGWPAPGDRRRANFLIRGTPYNRGVVLRDMLDQGASSVGDPTQCHAVAIDGRAPKFDGGIVTRLDCVPFSVVVNKRWRAVLRRGRGCLAQALRDLGAARRRAARSGRLCDHRCQVASTSSCPRSFRPKRADTIEGLARSWGLTGGKLAATVAAFNAACRPGRLPPDRARRPGDRGA